MVVRFQRMTRSEKRVGIPAISVQACKSWAMMQFALKTNVPPAVKGEERNAREILPKTTTISPVSESKVNDRARKPEMRETKDLE